MLAVSVSTGSTACWVTSQTWLRPCAFVPGSSRELARERLQPDREHEHDCDRQELLGHGVERQRRTRERAVGGAASPPRREDADPGAEQRGEQRRRQREDQGVGQRLADHVGDGPAGVVARLELTAERVADVDAVLVEQRAVEAALVDQVRALRRRHVRHAQEVVARIAHGAEEEEVEREHERERHQRQRHLLGDQPPHAGASAISIGSRCSRRCARKDDVRPSTARAASAASAQGTPG